MSIMQKSISSETLGHSKSLQGLRGFAALIMVLFHFTSFVWSKHGVVPFSGFFFFGYSGVNIFFVMSGFLMYYIHHKDFGDYRRVFPFMKKRFLRIYPVYWVVLIIAGTGLLVRNKIGLLDYFFNASLILLPERYISPPSWTLWYEVMLYIFIIIVILNKKIGFLSILLWIIVVVINNFSPITDIYLPVLNIFNISFPMGIAAAYIGLRLKDESRERFSMIAVIVGSVLFVANAGYSIVHSEPGNIVPWHEAPFILGWGMSCSLLMFSVFSNKIENIFGRCKPLLILGDASYSIFLLHFPLGRMLVRQAEKVNSLWEIKSDMVSNFFLIVVSCSAIIICYFFFRYIELPMIKYLKRRLT